MWSGLGYYRRARLLHRAAGVVADRGGRLPEDLQGLLELPGIGAYTAAAIGSIAFGIAEPAIDGNVERVISRLLAIDQDPKKGEGRRRIAAGARDLLDAERPGDSNQAMMELGATVCRPRMPRCSACPLAAPCLARASGEPELLPVTGPRPKSVRVRRRVAVVCDEGRVLLFRRSANSGQLAGLWELPWVDAASGFEQRYPGDWVIGARLGTVRHAITKRIFSIEILDAHLTVPSVVADGPEAGWFTRAEIANLPVSSLVTKVLAVADRSGAPAGRQ
jgi:A/G-specific adenine glycosylase